MTLIAHDSALRSRTATSTGGEPDTRRAGDPELLCSFGDVTNDPVRDYLRAIGRTRLLTADEEVTLARRIEIGVLAEDRALRRRESLTATELRELRTLARDGHRAYETFIQANLRLVVSIAKRYAGRGLPIMDVIQEGNLGLVRAVEKFDYTNGNKFSTYATWWIRQSILRGLADTARLIRIPVHTVEKIDKLDRIRRDLGGELGRTPTIEELAEVSSLSVAEIAHLDRSDAETVSFAVPVGEDGSAELGDIIEDDDDPGPEEQVQTELRHEDLERLLATLPPRDARVVRLRFGLDGRSPMTLDQVGALYGITRERVRQLETRSLSRLRTPELRDYLD